MSALAQLAEKGDRHAIDAVSARLVRGDGGVRRAAVDALAQLAEKGEQHAITAVSAREDDGVRRAAVDALARLQRRVTSTPSPLRAHASSTMMMA